MNQKYFKSNNVYSLSVFSVPALTILGMLGKVEDIGLLSVAQHCLQQTVISENWEEDFKNVCCQ